MSGGLDDSNSLQLNVTKRCKDRCSCTLHPDNIIVSEEKVGSAQDFIACTHERSTPFLLQQVLGSSENQLPSLIQNVTSVTVYYWEKVPTNPLFLKVIRSRDEEYYYKYAEGEEEVKDTDAKTWTHNEDTGIQLQERLDDRNCGVNRAIVYDLKNDYSSSSPGVEGDTKSKCKSTKRKITKQTQSSIKPPLGGNYTVKEYDVTGSGTKISRVTYGKGVDTKGITPPNNPVSIIRVYYWKHGDREKDIPLLIEFKPQDTGQSTWFENTDKTSLKWKDVTKTTNFYETKDGKDSPQQALTTKLDYVNCNVNGVTVIDIGKKPESRYCHNPDGEVGEGSHTSLIKVKDITNEDPIYNNNIGRFVVYSHDLTSEAKKKPHLNGKFHISGFKNGTTDIKLNESPPPLLNVTKFLVFWCGSGPKAEPLLFYVEHNGTGGSQQKEWFKKPPRETDPWTKLDDSNGKPTGADDTKAIWEILNSHDTECKFKWWHIITGTAGGGATGGVGYWAYKGFEWFFMAPWPRLM